MARNPAKMPSQRQLRVGEQMRHIMAGTLSRGDFGHPALVDCAHELSISEVRPSPDLKNARAYVVSLKQDQDMSEILDALNQEARIFQGDINRNSNLKFTPRVKFVIDESIEEASRIEELLRQVNIPDSE